MVGKLTIRVIKISEKLSNTILEKKYQLEIAR